MKKDIKQENKFFWLNRKTDTFVEVTGKPVVIAGFEDCDFFRNKLENGVVITEGKSGFSISRNCETYKDAMESAIYMLDLYTKGSIDKLKDCIEKTCENHGISPRYFEEGCYVPLKKHTVSMERKNKFFRLQKLMRSSGVKIDLDFLHGATSEFHIDIMEMERNIPNYDGEKCMYNGKPNYSMVMAIEEEWGQEVSTLISDLI